MPIADPPLSRTIAFDGAYIRTVGGFFDNADIRLSDMPWGLDVRNYADDLCVKGTANNTCMYACDRNCDEPMDESFGAAPACLPGTDAWDCDPAFSTQKCAQLCSDRSDCLAFAVHHRETRLNTRHCYFYAINVTQTQMWFNDDMVMYNKIGAGTSAAVYTPDPTCASFADSDASFTCPQQRCEWVPAGAVMGGSGPVDDPPCRDTNQYPHDARHYSSCETYRSIDESQQHFDGSSTDLLCDAAYIQEVCAVTCNASHACESAPSVCALPSDVSEGAAVANASVVVCGGDAVPLNGRCRCAEASACSGDACHVAAAGNGTVSVAA